MTSGPLHDNNDKAINFTLPENTQSTNSLTKVETVTKALMSMSSSQIRKHKQMLK